MFITIAFGCSLDLKTPQLMLAGVTQASFIKIYPFSLQANVVSLWSQYLKMMMRMIAMSTMMLITEALHVMLWIEEVTNPQERNAFVCLFTKCFNSMFLDRMEICFCLHIVFQQFSKA